MQILNLNNFTSGEKFTLWQIQIFVVFRDAQLDRRRGILEKVKYEGLEGSFKIVQNLCSSLWEKQKPSLDEKWDILMLLC